MARGPILAQPAHHRPSLRHSSSAVNIGINSTIPVPLFRPFGVWYTGTIMTALLGSQWLRLRPNLSGRRRPVRTGFASIASKTLALFVFVVVTPLAVALAQTRTDALTAEARARESARSVARAAA